jgi:TRAP-type mannitol/chloroaromatic compound transport system substrate-binding protein
VLRAYREISRDVVAEIGSNDELSKRIYASYQQFLGLIKGWSDIAEGAVLLGRRIA